MIYLVVGSSRSGLPIRSSEEPDLLRAGSRSRGIASLSRNPSRWTEACGCGTRGSRDTRARGRRAGAGAGGGADRAGGASPGELLVSLADSIPEEAHPLNGYL